VEEEMSIEEFKRLNHMKIKDMSIEEAKRYLAELIRDRKTIEEICFKGNLSYKPPQRR
jgi:hypothetical protein